MSSKAPWRAARQLVWAVGLIAAVVFAWSLISGTSERLLKRGAEAKALGYARYLVDATPGLETFFDTHRLDAQSHEQLKQLRRLGDVYRFKLFDREGRRLLSSENLDMVGIVPAEADQAIGTHHDADLHVRAIVLGGANFIETKRGAGQSDMPEVYVEAYVPMVKAGRVVGVVEVYVDQTGEAARIHAAFVQVGAVVGGLLLVFGGVLGVQVRASLVERRRAAESMRFLAEHDVLSGALNRVSFQGALQRAAWRTEQGGPDFAVLIIDLDSFKEVNDTFGHATGDAVLCEVTDRLQSLLRHSDAVARLGGDEFAVLQNAVHDAEDVERLAIRIVDALGKHFEIMGQRVHCGASVGAARFAADADTVADLVHKADIAMYVAKSGGKGRYSFYDPDFDQRLASRRDLARDLRNALADGAICLYYQPQYAADGGRLLGYEALMRWTHPTRGPVPPSEFIPLAEEAGQIEALGEWAMRRACAEAATWPVQLTVSVNLSAAQFRGQAYLIDLVNQALDAAGLPANRLVLEITESLLLTNAEASLRTLQSLAAMGVQTAMDDFGTGYSSLAYLWRFRFDKIKLDRAFTHGLGSDARVALIVRSIVTLAHSMGIRVNAEGVETTAQLEHLRTLGCDELQGYLLGRPLPAQELTHENAAESMPQVTRQVPDRDVGNTSSMVR